MVLSSRRASPAAEGEEQSVTNWRLIWITSTLELLFLTLLLMAWRFLPASHPKPEPATPQSLVATEAKKSLSIAGRSQAPRTKSDARVPLLWAACFSLRRRSAGKRTVIRSSFIRLTF